MTTEATALQRLGYVILGISPLLSLTEIANLAWRMDDGTLGVSIQLSTGSVLTVNVGMEGSGDSPAQIAVTAFDLLQEGLSENEQYWGQARPACRPGHAHPAACEEVAGAAVLICPEDRQQLRVLLAPTPNL